MTKAEVISSCSHSYSFIQFTGFSSFFLPWNCQILKWWADFISSQVFLYVACSQESRWAAMCRCGGQNFLAEMIFVMSIGKARFWTSSFIKFIFWRLVQIFALLYVPFFYLQLPVKRQNLLNLPNCVVMTFVGTDRVMWSRSYQTSVLFGLGRNLIPCLC